MHQLYKANPVAAVRGQGFIKELHRLLADELTDRLTPAAKRAGVRVVEEARLLGSHKPKDVDVAVIDKNNGPLVIVGVRSQMSSVGKNALNYYEGIVGECISLQDRFPSHPERHPVRLPPHCERLDALVQQFDLVLRQP
jgi:hypothetical protein